MTALRAVSDDEKPTRRPRQKTVTEAAAKGTTLELLVAMRERVAKAVEDPKTPPRDLASLTRKLLEIQREIEGIQTRDEEAKGAEGEVTDAAFDPSAI